MKILKVRSHAVLGMTLAILIVYPLFNDSRSMLILLTQIFIFGIFAMSYDLLLGYTGIVSFGHAMFFGIGAYSTGIFLDRMEPTMFWLAVSILVASVIAGAVSYIVGLLTLRLKSHFYAMLTLAFAGLFLVGAEKWRSLTFGNDGFTFRTPDLMKDRLVFYFICLGVMVMIFLLLKRFTHSPAGSVLQAIRENEQRVESIGYQVLHYKILASVIAGVTASLAGSLYGLSLRFVNTSVFTMDVTLDALLMTIIGGVGTLIGPIVGAGLIEFAHHFLTELAKTYPIFERWIIFFGILYILAVMFFPAGIVGSFKKIKKSKRAKEESKQQNIAS
ncbi:MULTISPECIES: branched-chain amino acid ABC transporter permease [Bacillaceae]|uniref:branched-chain amino acid ABC transporter permease n=1 Tax=Bacillaceae TaxID=186817 RepID=UPI001C584A5A|nr:branched-chain amino acid ABC transporter permease [Rossellomorea sp. YZS02]MBW3112026.1 branched-chain amino acid ABC transporter permease [Bacillus sp. MCCB 382]MDX8343472.1 branched-chain amino acid ABC transporter permease [Rossellomorea sp. YZS02]